MAECQVPSGGPNIPVLCQVRDGAKINVCSDGDQPADDRRRLEADPERRLCPEQGGVGLAVSEPYTQGPFLPSTRQTADVWQMPRDFLMLSSLYLFHR